MWHIFAKTFGELGDTGDRVCRFRALALICEAQDPKDWDTDVRKTIMDLLVKGRDPGILNGAELTELEALLLRVSPPVLISEWQKYFENDYRVLYGFAPPTNSATDPAVIRASLIALAGSVSRLRAVRRSLGMMRSVVCVCALTFAVAFFVAGASYLGLFTGKIEDRPLTIVVIMAGVLGGFISGTSRLYSLDWVGDVLLSTQSVPVLGLGVGLNLLLSVFEGGAFALMLYVMFAGGLLQGSLFPTFKFDDSAGASWISFVSGTVSKNLDIAKAIIWGFIAGFSERLVPDLLGQLAGSASANMSQKKD